MEKDSPPLMYHPRIGESIRGYEIVDTLGEGTFGFVYKVRKNGEVFALKLLKLWTITEKDQQDKIQKRFIGEYECGRMQSNFLVRSLEQGKAMGNPFIVMEFLENGDLRKRLPDFRSMSSANKLATQILLGLRDLHQGGIIHRDIKPENVMLDKRLNAKLADFGIAGFLNARLTVPNFFNGKVSDTFGTYAYIAPEQLEPGRKFKSTSDRTDIFSFGVLMYEVLSGGHYPFGNLSSHPELADYIKNASQGNRKNIRTWRPDIPAYWLAIFDKCLHPNYDARAKTVDEVLALLPSTASEAAENAPRITQKYNFYSHPLVLVVTQGEETGKRYPLSAKLTQRDGLIRIGWYDARQPGRNDIEIVENWTQWVSSYHATIERDWGQQLWRIRDGQYRQVEGRWGWYKSTNHVYVNHEKVDQCIIKPGDIITFGDTHLRVEIE